jgi:heavy metal translocating P-type ATPase
VNNLPGFVWLGQKDRKSLLIKNAVALETAHKINTVVLDKTGTITEGKPRVTDIYLNENTSEAEFCNVAHAIEKCSEHVIAGAIVADLESLKTEHMTVSDFENFSGKGIKGRINQTSYFAGNELFLNENAIDTSEISETVSKLSAAGKTPIIVANNNYILGIIGVSDKVKPDSVKAIQLLHGMGIEVIMLTGDNKNTAHYIGEKIGVTNIIAGVLPHEKEKQITNLQNKGRIVAMVGDGINDAPSLTSANLGVAIGAGTEIAIDSADVVLMRSKLMDVVTLLQLSKSVMRIIRQNLFWAFIYNIIGIPLAAGVFYLSYGLKLNPMFAAAAMSMSSVTVVLNALRLLRFKPLNIEDTT